MTFVTERCFDVAGVGMAAEMIGKAREADAGKDYGPLRDDAPSNFQPGKKRNGSDSILPLPLQEVSERAILRFRGQTGTCRSAGWSAATTSIELASSFHVHDRHAEGNGMGDSNRYGVLNRSKLPVCLDPEPSQTGYDQGRYI